MSISLPETARALVESGALGHLVTLNRDGSPQVSVVWVGLDGDELVTAHLNARLSKLRNVNRDPRVVVSFEGTSLDALGLREYLVVHGLARREVAVRARPDDGAVDREAAVEDDDRLRGRVPVHPRREVAGIADQVVLRLRVGVPVQQADADRPVVDLELRRTQLGRGERVGDDRPAQL